MKGRTKYLKNKNLKLENLVTERTKKVTMQKNEIFEQKEELQQQKEEIQTIADNLRESNNILIQRNEEIKNIADNLSKANSEISIQNKKITDSIIYAQRIQKALLPSDELLARFLPEFFIFFRPRDIVSGDFYWFKSLTFNNEILNLLVLADCTGHGVPGAFMSMLGISFLNEIIKQEDITNSGQVLTRLREYIKIALNQTGKEGETKDGMDMAFCMFNNEKRIVTFAGANLSAFVVKNNIPEIENKLQIFKGDRMPIGIYFNEKESFKNSEIQLERNDCLYLSTDGFMDQPGGKSERKFLSKKFQQLLIDIADKKIVIQKRILEATFENWLNGNGNKTFKQIDDVTVIGIKF
jgi:serine phosphatase RsbU (regulator of sigma subunit)